MGTLKHLYHFIWTKHPSLPTCPDHQTFTVYLFNTTESLRLVTSLVYLRLVFFCILSHNPVVTGFIIVVFISRYHAVIHQHSQTSPTSKALPGSASSLPFWTQPSCGLHPAHQPIWGLGPRRIDLAEQCPGTHPSRRVPEMANQWHPVSFLSFYILYTASA